MDSVEQAAHDLVHDKNTMNAKDIAALMGMNHQVLLNKVNPQNEFNKLSMTEAVALQLITGDMRIHRASEVALMSLIETEQPDHILVESLKLNKEIGDLNGALVTTLEDGRLTLREREYLQKEMDDIIKAIKRMRQSVAEHASSADLKAVS